MAFEHPGKWLGRAVELAGDELSMTQMAETLGRVMGREVHYQQVPVGINGLTVKAGREMTIMFRWFNDVGYNADIPTLRQEYPELATFETWLRGNGWGKR